MTDGDGTATGERGPPTLGYPLPVDGTASGFYEGFEWDLPEAYNIAALALDVRSPPDSVALLHADETGTHHGFEYAALDGATDAVAAGFAEAGVSRGDRVACCLPTTPEQLLVHLAAYRIGATVVPLSVLLGADTTADALARTTPDLLVVDRTVAAGYPEGTFDAAGTVHPIEPGPYTTGPIGGLGELATDAGSVEGVRTAPDDAALVVFTSGTTGAPKGVVLPHRYLAGSLPGYHCWFELFSVGDARQARVWTPSEWAWAGALFDVVFPTLALGGSVVSRIRRHGFDPGPTAEFVDAASVTHAFLPPTALAKWRRADPPTTPDSLDVVMAGGESLSPALRAWTESSLAVTVNHAYGQTEANALVGECSAAFEPEPGTIGRPYPGHDVVVIDGDGDRCDPGVRGELVVELPDPVAFLRYWEDPEETARVRDDRRLYTGDLARWTEDGTLVHAGRIDDLIITSGYRVDPLEVEHTLADHPAVAAAVVGGVPDDLRGEIVKAVIVLDDADADRAIRDALREHVRSLLGAHKVPREIEFVASLPETRTGKTDRDALF